MMDVKKIAEQINEMVETNEKEVRTELVKNLTDKACSYLMRDIYDEKNIKGSKRPYNMTEVLSTILWLTPNDQIKDILYTLPHFTLNKIKPYTEKLMQVDSLMAFIQRRDTIINKTGLTGANYKTYNFDNHILEKLCNTYVQKYNLGDDLKDIDFYNDDIALMYEIEPEIIDKVGKNKDLFDHFDECIKDILNE